MQLDSATLMARRSSRRATSRVMHREVALVGDGYELLGRSRRALDSV